MRKGLSGDYPIQSQRLDESSSRPFLTSRGFSANLYLQMNYDGNFPDYGGFVLSKSVILDNHDFKLNGKKSKDEIFRLSRVAKFISLLQQFISPSRHIFRL